MRLVMAVGAPGAGKSTFAATLDRTEWLVLSLDKFRDCLFGSKAFFWTDVVPKHGMDARRYVRNIYWTALNNALRDNRFNIFLDNTNVDPEMAADEIKNLGPYAKNLELMVFDCPAETLWRRNAERGPAEKLYDKDLARYITVFHNPEAWWRRKEWSAKIIRGVE